MKFPVLAFAVTLALVATATTRPGSPSAAGRQWWAHIQYLASDQLEGRNLGTPGFDLAANYVAHQFGLAGLRPAGTQKFFQPMEFTKLTLDESRSNVEVLRSGKAIAAKLGDDLLLGVSADSAGAIQAPLVFVGYGLKIPEANWDDLDGLPLKGAIAVYLRGGPATIAGNLRSHYSSSEQRWRALKAAGTVGAISIMNPKEMEIPWSRMRVNRLMPRMILADAAMNETPGLKFSAAWNPEKANVLFDDSGYSFRNVLDAADRQQPLPHFAMKSQVRARTTITKAPVSSKNVVGLRSGTDPVLARELVIISAHLDHLGKGPAIEGDGIYNGAMDDASGVASLIEIARAMQRQHVKAKRSILFLAVTGEEKGELGSKYYANDPTVEGRFVADINMDMFLPLFPLKYLEVQGLDESSLGDDIRAVCRQAGVAVQADKEPNKTRFIRSDQYSFIKKGVPALAFKFGYVPGTREEKVFQNWYKTRYHGPKDDLKQPVDLTAAGEFNDILLKLAIRVANAGQTPEWKPESFFRRFRRAQ